MEKYPKISDNNVNLNQYNMRPYIDNEYYNYKEFIFQLKKEYFDKNVEIYSEEQLRKLNDEFINNSKNDLWIIQLNGENIGFYNGIALDNERYQIENICIIPKYQNMGIENQIIKDITELYKEKDVYLKENSIKIKR